MRARTTQSGAIETEDFRHRASLRKNVDNRTAGGKRGTDVLLVERDRNIDATVRDAFVVGAGSREALETSLRRIRRDHPVHRHPRVVVDPYDVLAPCIVPAFADEAAGRGR